MYIVAPSEAAEDARRKIVLVIESEDGSVQLEYGGKVLVARAFAKDARVNQGAIVDNRPCRGPYSLFRPSSANAMRTSSIDANSPCVRKTVFEKA